MSQDRSTTRSGERSGGSSSDEGSRVVAGKRTLAEDLAHAGKGASPEESVASGAAGPGAGASKASGGGAKAGGPAAAPAATAADETGSLGGRAAAPTLSMSIQQMRSSDIPTTEQAGVAYTTVSGPTAREPGGYHWVVQWKLSEASPKGGWIVEHVKATHEITDKDGTVVATGNNPKYGYWEAWQVNKGKDITTFAEGGDTADDTYARGKSGDATKGTIKVMGTAEFYEDLTLPKSFKAEPSSPAGILPIVRSAPTLAGGTGSISHNLTATWDATGGDKTTTITT